MHAVLPSAQDSYDVKTKDVVKIGRETSNEYPIDILIVGVDLTSKEAYGHFETPQ